MVLSNSIKKQKKKPKIRVDTNSILYYSANMNTKNLVDEISSHVISILEDLDYGAEVNESQKKKLEEISNFLMNLSEDVGMQNMVTDIIN